MKKFYWLFLVPYVVTVSSNELTLNFKTAPSQYISPLYRAEKMVISCEKGEDSDCAWIYDLAAALNEAHEKREDDAFLKRGHEAVEKMKNEDALYWKDSKKAEWEPVDNNQVQFKPTHVTNQQACGQNDCGADPK